MAFSPLGKTSRGGGPGRTPVRLPSELSTAELKMRADELSKMADTATSKDVHDALRRLSERFGQLAAAKEGD